ncbi:putative skinny hedgehog/sightless/rasp [Operophtera brumata]|uniref:Putative skinny hedgehog/sightless/rasp n=1 Tax=Operophtera brumata TaxID=104452 RepID=A0A0L7L0U9_OPEBR|nr:putative skinny hedgehog/sightless/rasp [Operophtera brumata]
MKSAFNSFELSLYFIMWISINVYSLYTLFIVQNDLLKNPYLKLSLKDLVPGWSFLSRDKDVSDVEWSSWKFYIQTSWVYMIFQFLVTELLRKAWPSIIRYWFILSSLIFVILYMGLNQMLTIITQPIIFSIIMLLGGKRISIWLTSITLLLCYNSLKNIYFFWQFLDHGNLQDEEVYLLLFALAWLELRCVSFSIDHVERVEKLQNKKDEVIVLPSKLETVVNMFSYVLYLPLLYVGPIMLYEDFESSFHVDNQAKLIPRLKRFVVDMVLFLIYTFLMDLALHFMYFYAMQENMEAVKRLSVLALGGGGLWMGFQFHLKYVVSYGTTAAFARLDNMNPPPTPRYIYRPGYSTVSHCVNLPKMTYKLSASFVTFTFIFMWHGITWNIFVWSVLNYFGILIEYSAKALSVTDTYKRFKAKIMMSDAMEVRFVAFLCTPLLILSVISNFYLFAGSEVGDLFFSEILAGSSYNLSMILIAVYCCCQVSISLQNVSSRTDVIRLTKAD